MESAGAGSVSSLLVFPGQGAQQPGMLQRLPRETLIEASDVLGEDVLQLDSPQALRNTRAVQLCLLIAGVAASRQLLQDELEADFVAGLSIGAYPAAVVAGALDFSDALHLVSLRGELMQQAYPQGYGMTAIIGLQLSTVETLLAQVHSAETPVYLANINADNQVVIAGSDAAMSAVAELARSRGAGLAKRLAVSVPSHCPLLDEPAGKLAEAFASIELKTPKIAYLSGSRARPVIKTDALRDDLAFNMCRVVDWRGTVQSAYERGVRLQIELPPGAVLTGLARRVFEQGTVIAFDSARLDTLQALLREEGSRRP
jgi:malonate decarboxylase epsilon subunit